MLYTGEDGRLEWSGRMAVHEGYQILLIDDAPLTLGTGGIVPENWHGLRVRITVELLDGEN